jgi:Fic family protein
MHIPQRPPDLMALIERASARGDQARLLQLLNAARPVDEKGRYLHWDDFRRRPASSEWSIEEAWLATRTARLAAAQRLPLVDAAGQPFTFCEPPELREHLRHADLHAGGFLATDGVTLTPADGRRHFTRSLAEEPFASSFIEGAATTRQRAKQLIFDKRRPRTRDELMVLNNYRGLEHIKDIAAQPLSIEAILETHRIITQDTMDNKQDSGRLRTSDEVRVVDDIDGAILHQPPPFHDLRTRLQAVCDFANAPDEPAHFIHPVARAIILHFMIGYDHPFVDGNGRTARALFYWSMLKSGYWLTEYVSISSVIAEAKVAYGSAYLKTETDGGDLTYFLLHQANVLKVAIDRLFEYAETQKRKLTKFQHEVLDETGAFNDRQAALLQDAVLQRIRQTTIKEHETRYGVSRLTARSDLEELVRLKLFKKRKKGRQNFYIPERNIDERIAAR